MNYISSESIKVFPSAYRGTYIEEDSTKQYDPEAFLMTEGNLANIGNKITYTKQNYFYHDGNTIYIVLKGYLFVVDKSVFGETTPSNVFVGINIDDVASSYDVEISTLSPIGETGTNILDINDSFKGLVWDITTIPTTSVNAQIQIIKNGNWNTRDMLNISTPQISNGTSDNAKAIDKEFTTETLNTDVLNAENISTIHSSSLTASQAVSTDANKNLVSSNLTLAKGNQDGDTATFNYVDTVAQDSVGKVSITTHSKAISVGTNQGQIKVGNSNINVKGLQTTSDVVFATTKTSLTNDSKINGKSVIDIFESNSATVKNATNASNATNVSLDVSGSDSDTITISAGSGTAAEFTVNNVANSTNATNVDSLTNDETGDNSTVAFTIGDKSFSKVVNNVSYATSAGTASECSGNSATATYATTSGSCSGTAVEAITARRLGSSSYGNKYTSMYLENGAPYTGYMYRSHVGTIMNTLGGTTIVEYNTSVESPVTSLPSGWTKVTPGVTFYYSSMFIENEQGYNIMVHLTGGNALGNEWLRFPLLKFVRDYLDNVYSISGGTITVTPLSNTIYDTDTTNHVSELVGFFYSGGSVPYAYIGCNHVNSGNNGFSAVINIYLPK